MISRTRLFGVKKKITFVLPMDQPAGAVSVVGTFNSWTPGDLQLRPRRNGTRSVSVTLPPGRHHFRYLGENGVWFDDPTADHVDHQGSYITV